MTRSAEGQSAFLGYSSPFVHQTSWGVKIKSDGAGGGKYKKCSEESLQETWAHQDLNLGPTGYEPVALPAELWALQ